MTAPIVTRAHQATALYAFAERLRGLLRRQLDMHCAGTGTIDTPHRQAVELTVTDLTSAAEYSVVVTRKPATVVLIRSGERPSDSEPAA